MSAKSPILEVSQLSVTRNKETILSDLNFSVDKGKTFVIIGPNGSGKTILLKALLGMIDFEGTVSWSRGTSLGYVPQRVPLVRDIPVTVADFFKLKKITPQRTSYLLRELGLNETEIAKKLIGQLSSGQFQRLLIAWAMADSPNVLLFDEPMSGIDVLGEETIYKILSRLQKERELTVILVTHDLNIVYGLADQVLCLNRSQVCTGPPKEVLNTKTLDRLFGGHVKYFVQSHA